MTDIVERLRDPSAFPDTIRADCTEAADEIVQLRILNQQWEKICKRNADEIERLRIAVYHLQLTIEKCDEDAIKRGIAPDIVASLGGRK